jgi:hypothetical protein
VKHDREDRKAARVQKRLGFNRASHEKNKLVLAEENCHVNSTSLNPPAAEKQSGQERNALSHRNGLLSTGLLACVYFAGLLFSGSRKREQGAVCRRLQT